MSLIFFLFCLMYTCSTYTKDYFTTMQADESLTAQQLFLCVRGQLVFVTSKIVVGFAATGVENLLYRPAECSVVFS